MSRHFLLPLVLSLCLAGLGVALLVNAAREPGKQSAAIGGPFHLTSMTGAEVTDADFKGHPFLVYFGYTHCPDICLTVLTQMSQVLKAMGDDKRMRAVFISVDPQRGTPAVMKLYLSSFDPSIIGLSGTRAETEAIEKAYRVVARRVPEKNGDYTIDHTAFVFLINKEGHFVTPVDVSRPPQAVAKDLSAYF